MISITLKELLLAVSLNTCITVSYLLHERWLVMRSTMQSNTQKIFNFVNSQIVSLGYVRLLKFGVLYL